MNRKLFFIALGLLDGFMAISLLRTPAGLTVDVLDVGQGDAVLITTSDGNRILVDGGPDFSVLTELGEVLPPAYLKHSQTFELILPNLIHKSKKRNLR